ncbi:MAG: rhomboid family intramembrane serine protease [Gammaproteobacteria bacterium]|mgnify:CR=1 FL=1|nr:MAG: rhomboid family intramembrane serine protease [Gammaproteobacteria bacterium]
MKIKFNAPVILSFSILAVVVQVISYLLYDNFSRHFFSVPGSINWLNPLDYFRLISHVIGHSNWQHLFGNITYILLLGPILEEKYKSKNILAMLVITALITGLLNVLVSSSPLLGASGIVFMLITLVSFSDIKNGEIPVSFILVAAIFIGSEVISIFKNDNVSQLTHIAGAGCGAFFGFIGERRK